MRIAIWYNLNSGGAKRVLYRQVQGLVERGHYVESWCPSTADQTYLPLREIIKENTLSLPWREMSFAERVFRKISPGRRFTGPLWGITEHCEQCAQMINAGGFDVLLATSCIYLAASPIGQYINIPKLMYLHEPKRALYEAQPEPPWIALRQPEGAVEYLAYPIRFARNLMEVQGIRIQAREEFLNAKAYDKILTNSMFCRESIARTYGLDSSICYPGIDTDIFQPAGAAREPFVVGLGSMGITKGIDRAIRALAAIEQKKRPKLVWIGNVASPQYVREMEALAASNGVQFEPHMRVTDNELLDTLSRASLMIYTSRLEPLGLAPLEANACGTPVVAIAEAGVRETIINNVNGILVDGADPKALGIVISGLLDNPKQIEALGTRARQHVIEKWSWKSSIDRLEEYLIGVCNLQE